MYTTLNDKVTWQYDDAFHSFYAVINQGKKNNKTKTIQSYTKRENMKCSIL